MMREMAQWALIVCLFAVSNTGAPTGTYRCWYALSEIEVCEEYIKMPQEVRD